MHLRVIKKPEVCGGELLLISFQTPEKMKDVRERQSETEKRERQADTRKGWPNFEEHKKGRILETTVSEPTHPQRCSLHVIKWQFVSSQPRM